MADTSVTKPEPAKAEITFRLVTSPEHVPEALKVVQTGIKKLIDPVLKSFSLSGEPTKLVDGDPLSSGGEYSLSVMISPAEGA